MKKYFLSDGKEKHGPLSIEELKKENISKETLIWFEGLEDWKPAKELDEIKPILELQPPQILSEEKNESISPKENKTETADNPESQSIPIKKGMFASPFSFDGRIRRTEFGISMIIYFILYTFLTIILATGKAPIIGLIIIPILWFISAQGAKRCHDLGNSGWWQIIPFYGFWMLFQNGQPGINLYGQNPKG
tara:strand:- start:197 stop:772 length:576 start_codon:yes stop_codon:yes gene_type:complete